VTNHLNKEDGVLGIRSSGIARTVLKLARADPNDRTRLRLEVDGNYRPGPPLGLTIGDVGVEYSADAPEIVEGTGASAGSGRPGPKQTARAKAKDFLVAELSRDNDQKAVDLIERWVESGGSKITIFNAKDDLIKEGRLVVCDISKPQLWHLVAEAGKGEDAVKSFL
jgi:hypothetical protein